MTREQKPPKEQLPSTVGPAKVKLVPKMSVRVYRAAEDRWYTLDQLRAKEGW